MKTLYGRYPSLTGQQIFYRIWEPESEAKAIVQIIHGMAEHSERYDEFARFLCENGYIVAADDHAGHGRTAEDSGKYGFFDEKFGWEKVVTDLSNFNRQLAHSYELPIIILGHSMGSFLTRNLMINQPDIAFAWILSGTGTFSLIERWGGYALANINLFFKQPDKPARFLDKVSFGSYNKRFKADKSNYAWVCSNKDVVDAYEKDPYCGGVFSGAFFRDLLYGVNKIHARNSLKKLKKGMLLLIATGMEDPVGKYGKSGKALLNKYLKIGLKANLLEYKGMRHEILNETNKDQVYQDMLNWMENLFPNRS
jgi:alpha-beta hydrolase superfamily lysophospholipase